ncbi:MAG: hypothetical protein QME06_09065, partial [Desulfobacterales bacterium]|nr:hypothetical protein [Desulfobacterales bacterium]
KNGSIKIRHRIFDPEHLGRVRETNMAVFRGKEIRKTIYNNEWWFSTDPRHWGIICTSLSVQTEGGLELSILCRQLKLQSTEKASEAKNCKTKGHPL